MRLVVAIPTFNNLKFTKMCIASISENTTIPYELLIVDDGSTDGTKEWVKSQGINIIEHVDNLGICYTMNDMYDYALKDDDTILLITQSDTLMYNNAIDELFKGMVTTNYDCLGGCEVNISDLCTHWNSPIEVLKSLYEITLCSDCGQKHKSFIAESFPQYKEYENKIDKNFKVINRYPMLPNMKYSALTFFAVKKSFRDKVGYFDVNFFPLYFCDNDYLYRASHTPAVKMGSVTSSWYFHFQARTIHEGHVAKIISRYNDFNALYYRQKWGGLPNREKYDMPFNKPKYIKTSSEKNILSISRSTSNMNIFDRGYELEAIKLWKNRAVSDEVVPQLEKLVS